MRFTARRHTRWALRANSCRRPATPSQNTGSAGRLLSPADLEHDPEKWAAVFPRDKRQGRLRGDHAQTNEIERDDDSKKSHHALVGGKGDAQAPSFASVSFLLQKIGQEIRQCSLSGKLGGRV